MIGAGGGVGNAATQIARRLGARVIAVDQRPPPPEVPIRSIAEKMIVRAKDLRAETHAATGGRGADVVFEASCSAAPSTVSPTAAGSSKSPRLANAKRASTSLTSITTKAVSVRHRHAEA